MPPAEPRLQRQRLHSYIHTAALTARLPAACGSDTGIVTIHLLSKLATQAYKLAHLPQLGTETVGAR